MGQDTADQEHLRLLGLFHYINGGITAFIACFPLIHLVMGVTMIVAPGVFGGEASQRPPAVLGWLFAAVGGMLFLCGQALALCTILAGRFIHRRTHYMFILVTAGLECMLVPFGTVLGVFTIVALCRESVRTLFRASAPPRSAN